MVLGASALPKEISRATGRAPSARRGRDPSWRPAVGTAAGARLPIDEAADQHGRRHRADDEQRILPQPHPCRAASRRLMICRSLPCRNWAGQPLFSRFSPLFPLHLMIDRLRLGPGLPSLNTCVLARARKRAQPLVSLARAAEPSRSKAPRKPLILDFRGWRQRLGVDRRLRRQAGAALCAPPAPARCASRRPPDSRNRR